MRTKGNFANRSFILNFLTQFVQPYRAVFWVPYKGWCLQSFEYYLVQLIVMNLLLIRIIFIELRISNLIFFLQSWCNCRAGLVCQCQRGEDAQGDRVTVCYQVCITGSLKKKKKQSKQGYIILWKKKYSHFDLKTVSLVELKFDQGFRVIGE